MSTLVHRLSSKTMRDVLAILEALLRKSTEFVIPKPRSELWHRQRHSRGCARPGEPIEDGGTALQFGELAVKVTMMRSPSSFKHRSLVSTRLRRFSEGAIGVKGSQR